MMGRASSGYVFGFNIGCGGAFFMSIGEKNPSEKFGPFWTRFSPGKITLKFLNSQYGGQTFTSSQVWLHIWGFQKRSIGVESGTFGRF